MILTCCLSLRLSHENMIYQQPFKESNDFFFFSQLFYDFGFFFHFFQVFPLFVWLFLSHPSCRHSKRTFFSFTSEFSNLKSENENFLLFKQKQIFFIGLGKKSKASRKCLSFLQVLVKSLIEHWLSSECSAKKITDREVHAAKISILPKYLDWKPQRKQKWRADFLRVNSSYR